MSRQTSHNIALSGATLALVATMVSLLAMVIPIDRYSRGRGLASLLVLGIVIVVGVLATASLAVSATLTEEGNRATNQMTHKERSMTDAATAFAGIALAAFAAYVAMTVYDIEPKRAVWAVVAFAGTSAVAGALMAAVASSAQRPPLFTSTGNGCISSECAARMFTATANGVACGECAAKNPENPDACVGVCTTPGWVV